MKGLESQVRESDLYLWGDEELLKSRSLAEAGLWMDQWGALRGCAIVQARDNKPGLGR